MPLAISTFVFLIFSLIFRLVSQIDPTCKAKKKAKERAEGLLKRLGIPQKKLLNLSEYEMVIAGSLVVPDDISVCWKDIAGLDNVIMCLF